MKMQRLQATLGKSPDRGNDWLWARAVTDSSVGSFSGENNAI